MKHVLLLGCALALIGFSASAEAVVGVWKTQPDRKDLVSHIEIVTCGAGVCGTVKRVFDKGGDPVVTRSLGKRLFWNMLPKGEGRYAEGTVWVPLLDITTRNGQMRVDGNKLYVEGRVGPIKGKQVWTRLQ